MGRGASSDMQASQGFALLGKGRHGTRVFIPAKVAALFTEEELADKALFEEIIGHTRSGGSITLEEDSRHWEMAGRLHREGGPAIECLTGHFAGSKQWYRNGKLDRENGPAFISVRPTQPDWYIREWWQDGKKHREDGPAVTRLDGPEEWYYDGKLHRPDGPAIKHADGTEEWYIHGEFHREDGPAITKADGTLEWWAEDELHCEYGPAVVYPDGREEWWLDGQQYADKAAWKEALERDANLEDLINDFSS